MTNRDAHNAYKNRQSPIVKDADGILIALSVLAVQLVFICAIFSA